MILYIENSVKTNKQKLLELINNSARLKDTRSTYRNQLYLYVLAMNNPKIRNNCIYNSIQRIKHFGNKSNKRHIKYIP